MDSTRFMWETSHIRLRVSSPHSFPNSPGRSSQPKCSEAELGAGRHLSLAVRNNLTGQHSRDELRILEGPSSDLGDTFEKSICRIRCQLADGGLRSNAGKDHGMLCFEQASTSCRERTFTLKSESAGGKQSTGLVKQLTGCLVFVCFYSVVSCSPSSCGGMSPNRTAFEDLWR